MGRVIHCAVALTAAGIAPRLEAIAPLPSSPRYKNKRRGFRGCPPVGVRGRGPARAESAIEHPITRPRFRAGRKIIKGTGRRRQSDEQEEAAPAAPFCRLLSPPAMAGRVQLAHVRHVRRQQAGGDAPGAARAARLRTPPEGPLGAARGLNHTVGRACGDKLAPSTALSLRPPRSTFLARLWRNAPGYGCGAPLPGSPRSRTLSCRSGRRGHSTTAGGGSTPSRQPAALKQTTAASTARSTPLRSRAKRRNWHRRATVMSARLRAGR